MAHFYIYVVCIRIFISFVVLRLFAKLYICNYIHLIQLSNVCTYNTYCVVKSVLLAIKSSIKLQRGSEENIPTFDPMGNLHFRIYWHWISLLDTEWRQFTLETTHTLLFERKRKRTQKQKYCVAKGRTYTHSCFLRYFSFLMRQWFGSRFGLTLFLYALWKCILAI